MEIEALKERSKADQGAFVSNEQRRRARSTPVTSSPTTSTLPSEGSYAGRNVGRQPVPQEEGKGGLCAVNGATDRLPF